MTPKKKKTPKPVPPVSPKERRDREQVEPRFKEGKRR